MYRCPLCGFRTIRLFALKQHVRRSHITTICPICGRQYANIYQHFYTHIRDSEHHLVLCYLYTRYKLDFSQRQKVKELLEVQ